ncbi:TRIHELIX TRANSCRIPTION FACTOR ASIL2-LIKE [Salix viminalis]|uniref:TRIHELIX TRANSCRIPTION FACTOR ASIL2-LIKE n=1 Tax=Salix viminalis TaxID=40686 RepID=A0A9Q0T860_SALVM|nr:TRIHELIX TRANSCRIPTION FACTOR ASIL2-LIKE [Salix viminalis]
MSTTPSSDITTKRVPPPCWTQEESIALIKAYRDKWYSVNRGHLRVADWEAVAAAVPSKSSLQCRHKIEKLRKRYRAEKQKCLKYPGRFFSSWDLFPLLDSIEIGSLGSKVEQEIDEGNDAGDGLCVKTLGDRYLLIAQKNRKNNGDLDPDEVFDLDPDFALRARKYSKVDGDFSVSKDSGSGFGVNSVAFRPNDYVGVNGKIKAKVGFNCDHGGEVGYKMERTPGDRSFMPQGVRLPDYAMMADHHGSYNNSYFSKGVDVYEGFPLKSIGDRNLPIQGLNPKNYKKIDRKPTPVFCDDDHVEIDYRIDKRDRFGKKVNDGWSSSPPGFIPNNCGNIGGKSRSDSLSRALKGSVNGDGVKTEADSVALLVSAIEQATESFVKVEMMKMDMAMEIEKMRMEMGLKHNQMILESQQQIVDALAKAMLEKTKRKKVEVLSSNSNRNGYTQVAAVDCESIGKGSVVKESETCVS